MEVAWLQDNCRKRRVAQRFEDKSTAVGLYEMKSRVANKQRLSAREMTVGKLPDCNAEKRRDYFVLMEALVGVSLSQQRSLPKVLQIC
jgi:hypothetical protein